MNVISHCNLPLKTRKFHYQIKILIYYQRNVNLHLTVIKLLGALNCPYFLTKQVFDEYWDVLFCPWQKHVLLNSNNIDKYYMGYQQSYPAMPGLSRQEYIVQAYCVLYCYVQSMHIVQISFFLSTQCSLVDSVLRLSSWRQDGEASAGADPGASDVEL